jgi:hypothetical protein
MIENQILVTYGKENIPKYSLLLRPKQSVTVKAFFLDTPSQFVYIPPPKSRASS